MTQPRHICTKEDPWKMGMGRAIHPDAIPQGSQQGGYPSGDIQVYKCPYCNLRFEVELPQ